MFGKRRRNRHVHVFGAGPAGLMVAHAARQSGCTVSVFTRGDAEGNPVKSELHGCQYLHTHIPGVGLTRQYLSPVRYLLMGPSEGYRQKVYGNAWNGTVSPDEYGPEEHHVAYDLRHAYDNLWEAFQDVIYPLTLNAHSVSAALQGTQAWKTFSTVPAPSLCARPDHHTFASADIWAMGTRADAHGLDRSSMPFRAPDGTIVCNGERDTRWYRAATVFGHSTLEWPDGARPPITGVVRVSKPLSTDCDCWARQGLNRLGRYGEWRKGVLVHQVYERALEFLK